MALESQGPTGTQDATGTVNVPTISPLGEISVTSDTLRRIQEQLLLIQTSSLVSTQLVNEKTSKYNFMEIR